MPNRNQFGAPKLVYRIDSRSPEEVFQHGFSPWGSNLDFFGHILGDTLGHEAPPERRSGLISTSDSPDSALRFFGERLHVPTPAFYLYEIRATNNFYSAQRTASFYEHQISTGRLDVDHGSFDDACSAIELLRTAFAYQREWFSVGAIPGNQIRSAWRVDTVPIDPSHIRHQTGVYYTPRINEPEILNSNYVDAETYANNLPYTNGRSLTDRTTLTMPNNLLESDAGGGVEASLGFACFVPDSPSRSPRSIQNKELVCYYPNDKQLVYDLHKKEYDQELSEVDFESIYLTGSENKSIYKLSYKNENNMNKAILLNESSKNMDIEFIYDSFQCLIWRHPDNQFSWCLTPIVEDNIHDTYRLNYSIATTNEPTQKWRLSFVKKENNISYFRVENLGIKFFSLYRDKNTNELVMKHINDKFPDYEELFLTISKDKYTSSQILVSQNPITKLVDLQLSWFYSNQNYVPIPEKNTSIASRPIKNRFFYDLITHKIMYIDSRNNVFALYNNRDYHYNVWDWVRWIPNNFQITDDKRLKWYFINEPWYMPDDNNYRKICSFENNDRLKVDTWGVDMGVFYTSWSGYKLKNETDLFRISIEADL